MAFISVKMCFKVKCVLLCCVIFVDSLIAIRLQIERYEEDLKWRRSYKDKIEKEDPFEIVPIGRFRGEKGDLWDLEFTAFNR